MNIQTADGLYEISEEILRALKRNYPGIDVDAELDQMALWTAKNASRRPKVYPLRFVERWLNRARPKPTKMHIVAGKMSERDMLLSGRLHGIEPRPGEGWEQFGRRLREKMS